MTIAFNDFLMVCNSTQNQIVNLLPALQLGIKRSFIMSTEMANNRKWTERLDKKMKEKGIKIEVHKIDNEDEKSIKVLTEKLLSLTNKYEKIFWNISGGQKIPTVALHNAFERRVKAGFDDRVVYVEGNDANIFFYGKDYELKKQRIDVNLSLADLLYLNDSKIYEAVEIYPGCDEKAKKLIDIASKALEIYKNNAFFREAFFSLMATPLSAPKSINDLKESIKKTLNSLKPSLSELKLKKDGYQNLEDTISELVNKIRDIKKVEEVIKKLKIIGNPKEIYEDYWNSIKKACIEKIVKDIYSQEEPLFKGKQLDKQDFIKLINELEGEFLEIDNSNGKIYKQNIKKLTYFSRNSELFEWMVAASILDAINKDSNIKNAISEVHCNVKTQQLNIDSGKYDAEIDVLITTKFGTLIVLEAKTYDFSGDTAKSRETIAYKKSGPFARAIIVGPLLTNIVKKRPDGSIECPDYIDKKTCDQPETAKINNITYWYLDEIQEKLKKELKLN